MFELFDPSADIRITGGTNLPHWFQPAITYFVTFRTEDSMPADVSKRWFAERQDWLERRGISISQSDWKDRFAELPLNQK